MGTGEETDLEFISQGFTWAERYRVQLDSKQRDLERVANRLAEMIEEEAELNRRAEHFRIEIGILEPIVNDLETAEVEEQEALYVWAIS